MKTKNAIPVTETESFWKKHYERFQLSKLSKAAYARKYGLIRHRFIYWSQKFEKALKKPFSVKSDFIPIKIESSDVMIDKTMPALCTVNLGNGKQLLLHSEAALKLCLDILR